MKEIAASGNGMVQDRIVRIGPAEGERLLEVWEASVRATHDFLTETDIQFFKPLVLQGLLSLEYLAGVRDGEGQLIALVGVEGKKIEALFVHPAWFRTGVGRRLTDHAVAELGATLVDVNEQNHGAVAFYRRLGFEVEGRSEFDSTGKPFPLLHMRKDVPPS
jgi:putative acetyltransferase